MQVEKKNPNTIVTVLLYYMVLTLSFHPEVTQCGWQEIIIKLLSHTHTHTHARTKSFPHRESCQVNFIDGKVTGQGNKQQRNAKKKKQNFSLSGREKHTVKL